MTTKKKPAKRKHEIGVTFDEWRWYQEEYGYRPLTFISKAYCESRYRDAIYKPGRAVRVKFVEVK